MLLNDFLSWHKHHCETSEKKGCARTAIRLDRDMDSDACRSCLYNHLKLKAEEESLSINRPGAIPSSALPPVFLNISSDENLSDSMKITSVDDLLACIRAGNASRAYNIGDKIAFVCPITVDHKNVDVHFALEIVDFDHVLPSLTGVEHSMTCRLLMHFYPKFSPLSDVAEISGSLGHIKLLTILESMTRSILGLIPGNIQAALSPITKSVWDLSPNEEEHEPGDELVAVLREYTSKLWLPSLSQLGVSPGEGFEYVGETVEDHILDAFNPAIVPNASANRTAYEIRNLVPYSAEYWTCSMVKSTDETNPVKGLAYICDDGATVNMAKTPVSLRVTPFVTIA